MSESKGEMIRVYNNKHQVFIGQIGENGWLGVDELLELKHLIDMSLQNLMVHPDTDPETKDWILMAKLSLITTLEIIKRKRNNGLLDFIGKR